VKKDPFSSFPMDSHFTQQYLTDMKGMMKQLNQSLNEGFWENLRNITAPAAHLNSTNQPPFPIEIWETDDQYYLLAGIPGLKSVRDIRVSFIDSKTVLIRAKPPMLVPAQHAVNLHSDFQKTAPFERKINLPGPVRKKSYTSSYNQGVFTMQFSKRRNIEYYDAPIDY
jgi:HSP20 family molecular chaperone IbpA